MTEASISFDISSDVLHHAERQLGGIFFGKLTSHLTSCLVWVLAEDGWFTTINPGVANIGWGENVDMHTKEGFDKIVEQSSEI